MGLAQTDLKQFLNIIGVLDRLKQGRNYTLRQIAKECTKAYDFIHSEDRTVGLLKNINDTLGVLETVRPVPDPEDPEQNLCYLYTKKMSSEEARETLIKYNAKHFKTPLTNRDELYLSDHTTIDDFL